MSKKGNVTDRLGWQGKAQTHRIITKNLACGMSQICHVLEDTPGDTEIHTQISKRQMYKNLRFFEIQVFVFDYRRIANPGL